MQFEIAAPPWSHAVHHDGSDVFVSSPLPQVGDTVTIRLRVPSEAPLTYVYLRAVIDGEFDRLKMKQVEQNDTFAMYAVDLPVKQTQINYRFKLLTEQTAWFYTAAGFTQADLPDVDDFSLIANYNAPLWVREQVFYQIFPDRFYNGEPANDVQDGDHSFLGFPAVQKQWGEIPQPYETGHTMEFYGGDLQGITQKLGYLKDLGITGLYLCPIFVAETNHKYDIVDFNHVDPSFGGDEALVQLRQATAAEGMRLILDVTPNHISYQHQWIRTALEDPDSQEAEYFYIDRKTGDMALWMGVRSLIKLNYSSQALRDRMYRAQDSVLRHWLQQPYDIDGWRLDVANMTGNYQTDQLDHDVFAEMRTALKAEKHDAYIMGEWFLDGTPHTQGTEVDATMNYRGFNIPVRRWLGGEDLGVIVGREYGDPNLLPSVALAHQWQRLFGAVPFVIALQQFHQLGSHDTSRIMTVVHEDDALARLGATLLATFPGVPCVYYGDEIGMIGGDDPDMRRTMLWDEADWHADLLAHYRRVIDLRLTMPALQHGGFQVLDFSDDMIAYQRHTQAQTVVVVAYRGAGSESGGTASSVAAMRIDLARGGHQDGTQFVDALTDTSYTVADGVLTIETIAHGQGLILVRQ